MKEFFENWFGAMILAWRKLVDFSLPGKLQKYVPLESAGVFEPAAFPLLGWLAGMLVAVCAFFVTWIFNRYTGAFVFALLGWLIMTLRDSGRGDGMVTGVISSWLPGDSVPWKIVIPVAAEILKFALLMLMFYRGCICGLALVLAGGFAVEAILAVTLELDPPLLDDTPEAKHKLWMMLGVLGGISFVICQFSTLAAVLVFIAVWRLFAVRAEKNILNVSQISFAGSVMSWILLISIGIII